MQSRYIVAIAALLFPPGIIRGQLRTEFEVASIRSADTRNPQVNAGVSIDGNQVRYRLVPLLSYIGYAYDVRTYQIVGPDWLKTQYFDVVAKLPAGATKKDVPKMLDALLADRFGLKVHRETRDLPVYALEVAKGGLKMQEVPHDPADSNEQGATEFFVIADRTGGTYNFGGGAQFASTTQGFEGKKMTMAALAYMLSPFLDHPSVDMTGLKGAYDFSLNLTEEDRAAIGVRAAVNAGVTLPPQVLRILDNASGASLFDALQKLGLALVSRKAPVEVIVVDAMQKTPTEN